LSPTPRYHAIAIDVGDEDRLRADAGKLHDALDRYGIANTFEAYPGTHTSKLADRFQNHVMRFFSQSLCFQGGCRSPVPSHLHTRQEPSLRSGLGPGESAKTLATVELIEVLRFLVGHPAGRINTRAWLRTVEAPLRSNRMIP